MVNHSWISLALALATKRSLALGRSDLGFLSHGEQNSLASACPVDRSFDAGLEHAKQDFVGICDWGFYGVPLHDGVVYGGRSLSARRLGRPHGRWNCDADDFSGILHSSLRNRGKRSVQPTHLQRTWQASTRSGAPGGGRRDLASGSRQSWQFMKLAAF